MEKQLLQNENQKKETGATMLEYALMAALIAVVAIAAVTFLGQQASQTFSGIGSQLKTSGTGLGG